MKRAAQRTLDLGLPLLNRDAARAAAEDGMAAAEHLTDDDRKQELFDTIVQVARQHRYFTADQIWAELGEVGDDLDDGSGLGPIMPMAARQHIIEKTGTTRPSERAATHGRPMRIWRSLIFGLEEL